MPGWHIGVIGGSGLYEAGALDEAQQIPVASPFGEPSGPVTTSRTRPISENKTSCRTTLSPSTSSRRRWRPTRLAMNRLFFHFGKRLPL